MSPNPLVMLDELLEASRRLTVAQVAQELVDRATELALDSEYDQSGALASFARRLCEREGLSVPDPSPALAERLAQQDAR